MLGNLNRKGLAEQSGPEWRDMILIVSSSGRREYTGSSSVIMPRSTHWRAATWVMNLPADPSMKVLCGLREGALGAGL